MAEHFRRTIVRRYVNDWNASLPRVPYTTEELRERIQDQFLRDEQTVIAKLAALGSTSTQIITRLQPTREVIVEAMQRSRNERRAQRNLLQVLSTTRYRMLTKEGLKDTVCSLSACSGRDASERMPQRYDLTAQIEISEASVAFLVKTARKTQMLDRKAPRPYRPPHQ